MKSLAIVGASYLQLPLIEKAKALGIETHVFAWAANDVGEQAADYFYPISIVEKEMIAAECRRIGVDGICSIASDLAMLTVNYVANALGLVGNSTECTLKSTNKHLMREAFKHGGDPSPQSILIETASELKSLDLQYPIIVKPTDRSGSRGITKLTNSAGLEAAVSAAKECSFEKKALVEEFAEGQEYSVECISQNGKHHLLAITQKHTTGAPHFIETAHIQPAQLSNEAVRKVERIIFHALETLEITTGASHSEVKIDGKGNVFIIEIGGRMGGDFIGSDLVQLSTGVDFVKAVIQIALGESPDLSGNKHNAAAVRFVFSEEDLSVLQEIKREHPEILVREDVQTTFGHTVTDSANRFGYYILQSNDASLLRHFMPE